MMAISAAIAVTLHASAMMAAAALVELAVLSGGYLASAPSTTGIPATIPPDPPELAVELGASDPLVALSVGIAPTEGVWVSAGIAAEGGATVRLVAVDEAM